MMIALTTWAQAPEAVNYQAVVRDAQGGILASQTVNIRLTVIDSSTGGVVAYTEDHKTATNDFGLVNVKLGEGVVTTGNFSAINWANGPYHIEVFLDLDNAGTNYISMGISELISVPYSLYSNVAGTALNTDDADADPTNELQSLSLSNDTLRLSSGGFVILQSNTGPAGPAGTNGADGATGATGPQGDPATDDQTLNWNGGSNTLTISGGNSVVLPISGGSVGPTGPTGVQGAAGAAGPAGADGATGPTGPQGAAGVAGPAGANGATGPTGLAGATGPQGDPATDDQTLNWNGGSNTLTISGGNSVVLPISGGSVGPTGPQGTAGATGPAGTAGPTGPQGIAGPQGLQGVAGPAGPAGANGLNGAAGPAGPQGVAGVAGPAGANGSDGATGPTGPAGTQGATGAAGPIGPTGPGGGGGTLDAAYDFGGPGVGRVITADAGGVEINTSGTGVVALDVTNTGTGVAIQADANNAANTFSSIQATTNANSNIASAITGSSSSLAYGLSGQAEATSTTESAILGNNLRTTGGHGVLGRGFNGVVGENAQVQGSGVYGQNNAAASGTAVNPAAGVTALGYYGVVGQTQTNGGFATYGLNVAPNVSGTNDNAGVGGLGFTGVLGATNTPGVGFGILANEDVGAVGGLFCNGNLVAGGVKTFRIDHPTDPENMYLRHFTLESDEVLNIYRGNVLLDANGEGVVTLPSYFHDINHDFSYHLTPVGGAAPGLYIKEEIGNGQFVVAGGTAGLKVSWQVMAERNDLYLQQNPDERIVEQNKPAHNVGKFVHPELFGKPKTDGVISVKDDILNEMIQEHEVVKQQPLNLAEVEAEDE